LVGAFVMVNFVSESFAILLLTVPRSQLSVCKSGVTWPRVLWSRHHWRLRYG